MKRANPDGSPPDNVGARRPIVALIGLLAGMLVVGAILLAVVVIELRDAQGELHHDEQEQKATVAHTKVVQEQGAPVAVCLREALEAVEPLLLQVPSVEAPLSAYVRLQSNRYVGTVCPESQPSHP